MDGEDTRNGQNLGILGELGYSLVTRLWLTKLAETKNGAYGNKTVVLAVLKGQRPGCGNHCRSRPPAIW